MTARIRHVFYLDSFVMVVLQKTTDLSKWHLNDVASHKGVVLRCLFSVERHTSLIFPQKKNKIQLPLPCLIRLNLLLGRASPPTTEPCTGHRITQTGKANFKVRKIPNEQSAACTCRCVSKVGPLVIMSVTT